MKSLLQSQHDIFSNHQDETGHWESHENDISATMKLHNLQVEVWRKKGDSGLIRAHKWALFMVMWVKQCHKPSPSHHHVFIGGMFTIPSHGWFMTLFYPH